MSFCPSCGEKVPDDAKFCTNCGAPIEQSTGIELAAGQPFEDTKETQSQDAGYQDAGYQNAGFQGAGYQNNGYQNHDYEKDQATIDMLLSKIDTAATLWMVIGIVQIVLGVIELCIVYGVVVIGIGIWSIWYSKKLKGQEVYFRNNPREMITYVETQKTTTIVMLVINIVFGSVVGIIPGVYELILQDQIESNRQVLNNY